MDVSHQPLGPNQTKWIEALESGNYNQCTGRLFNGEGYCCLGVGARVFLGDPTVFPPSPTLPDLAYTTYEWEEQENVVPLSLKNKLGLHDVSGEPNSDRFEEDEYDAWDSQDDNYPEVFALVTLNDEKGWTFSQIAAHLRKFAHIYFKKPR